MRLLKRFLDDRGPEPTCIHEEVRFEAAAILSNERSYVTRLVEIDRRNLRIDVPNSEGCTKVAQEGADLLRVKMITVADSKWKVWRRNRSAAVTRNAGLNEKWIG